jgi:predicted ATP-binding protein involved in virulence
MRIDSIKLWNFRGFEHRAFSLGSRFNLVIGDNATGKTTLLEALSVGIGALFLDFPPPAEPRNLSSTDARLATYRHGDTWTVEPQYPVVIECRGEVDQDSISWSRALASEHGRTTRQDATSIRDRAARLKQLISQGKPVALPIISYYATKRL